jgi:putative membrane-bound dehydrogenase-like protein
MARMLGTSLMRSSLILLILPLGLGAAEPQKTDDFKPPLSPQQARAAFRVSPGLRVELVAAEPDIESPVAVAFDEDGRLWVVEMRDYPNGPVPGQPPEGRIRVLEDRDGDGRYERNTVFAEQLLFANGLLPWKDGVIVTAAPHILFLQDTDGDGKADKREVLYEGFAALNPQLRVSHPVLGLDGWVYVANGLRGGQVIRSGQKDAKPLNLGGMDFRFDLVHDRHEAISGMGQYGNTFDDWGRRFVCDNRHHLRHVVLPSRYVQRNPFLAVPEPVEDVSELGEGPLSSGGKIYPLSKNWTTSNLHAGRFTAACGVLVYRGTLLPPEYRGCAFTCDPTGNLVHQEVLRQKGATFSSKPPKEGVEFLATPDDWCRPVSLAHGPDGALYVVDMYRAVIEHPEFMPQELKNRPDLTLGKDRGRIWRIVPEKGAPKGERPRLSQASVAELVKLLEHPDAWWRTTAQRLLLQRQDRSAIEPLRKLVAESKEALARLHAAWLLESCDALEEGLLMRLLKDEHPRLREHAILLAERLLPKSREVQQRVIALAEDADPQVRFQAALSLGEWDDDRILLPLARIALAGLADRWTRYAVASAVPARAGALLVTLLRPPFDLAAKAMPERLGLLRDLAALAGGRRDSGEVAAVLSTLAAVAGSDALRWQMTGLDGLAEGMGRRGTQLGEFLKGLPEPQRPAAAKAALLLKQAAPTAEDAKRDLAERLPAVRLLGHAPWEIAQPVLTRLLTDEPLQEARLATVRALANQPRPEIAALLLKPWPGYTPAVRREVTEALLRQPDRTLALLREVEAGRVKPGDIDVLRTRQLLSHTRPDIRELAKKLLQDNIPADRKKVLDKYRAALELKGDPKRGLEVFRKNCATCHRVAGVGVDVGPDISDTPRTRAADALLVDILNPNQAIDTNYISYLVTTKSGKSVSGIIAAETASSLTLRRAENQSEVILRQDIDEIQSTGISLMPDGLEKTITVEEMADLLAFLKNWRYLDGSVPVGERPPAGRNE